MLETLPCLSMKHWKCKEGPADELAYGKPCLKAMRKFLVCSSPFIWSLCSPFVIMSRRDARAMMNRFPFESLRAFRGWTAAREAVSVSW